MMTKTITKKRAWCGNIALILVLNATICVFSTKVFAQNIVNTVNTPTGGVENTVTDKNGMITRGNGVSQELLTEYQEIVNKYLEKLSFGNQDEPDRFYWKSDYLLEEDWTRLYVIFVQMTGSQQMEQMIGFMVPVRAFDRTNPPPQRYYDLWVEEDCKCKIWIDDKQVDNSVLNTYEPSDFVRYNVSTLFRSGGQRDEYRVDLWTETGHKKFSEQFFEQPVSIDKLLEIEPKIGRASCRERV